MSFESTLAGRKVEYTSNDQTTRHGTFVRFMDSPLENQDGDYIPNTVALVLTSDNGLQEVFPHMIKFTEDFAIACKPDTKPDVDPDSPNAESKEKYNNWLIKAQQEAERLYSISKDAPAKSSVVCPTCRVMFQKNRAAQAFCGESQCKQDYWNLVRQKPKT